MLVVGFVLNSTTVLIPLFAQQLLGYNATHAGLSLMPGGFVLMLMFPLAGQLVRRVQPKYMMAVGLMILTASLYHLSGFETQVSFEHLAWARVIQCVGLPLFFIPLNTIAYSNLPAGKSNSASAMMNLMRNLGGSIGIAVATTLLTRRTQVHQADIAASATHFYQPFVNHMHAMGGFTQKNIVGFYNTVQVQAAMLSYLDVFRIMTVVCVIVIGLVLMLRRVKHGEQAVVTHYEKLASKRIFHESLSHISCLCWRPDQLPVARLDPTITFRNRTRRRNGAKRWPAVRRTIPLPSLPGGRVSTIRNLTRWSSGPYVPIWICESPKRGCAKPEPQRGVVDAGLLAERRRIRLLLP